MSKNEPVVLAEHFAPYTDPGTTGQAVIETESTTVAPDSKAPGTPPANGWSGEAGERAASLFDREQFKEQELSERSTRVTSE